MDRRVVAGTVEDVLEVLASSAIKLGRDAARTSYVGLATWASTSRRRAGVVDGAKAAGATYGFDPTFVGLSLA